MLKLTVTLLVALAMCAGAPVKCGEPEPYNDWEEFHHKIFNVKDKISPEETLGYLKKLNELYTGRTDKYSVKRSKLINNLLKVSDVSESHCLDFNHMEIGARLLRKLEGPYDINVIPYLKQFAKQQLDLCKTIVENEYEVGKRAIGRLNFQKMERLEKCIRGSSVSGMHESISSYLQDEKKQAFPKFAAFKNLSTLYRELVQTPMKDFLWTFAKIAYLAQYNDEYLTSFDQDMIFLFKGMRRVEIYDKIKARRDFYL